MVTKERIDSLSLTPQHLLVCESKERSGRLFKSQAEGGGTPKFEWEG